MHHEPVRRHPEFLGRPGRSPRRVPAPTAAVAGATYNGIYMRPNLNTTSAALPAVGPYTCSPDIWIAGTTPLADPKALATAASYATQSPPTITENTTNFIYIRGYNDTTGTLSRTATLYYSPCAVVPWPGMWQNNVIPTDQGAPNALISELAPSSIGVANATYQWVNVPPPPPGSIHYCLFAQLNDPNDPNYNPFPDVSSQIDMSALLTNNLGWGWRNTVEVPPTSTFNYTMQVTIDENIPLGTATYYIFVNPSLPPGAPAGSPGFVGYNVSFTLSEPDANGNIIQLQSTPILQNGTLIGLFATLEPGYSATCTVNMTSNGLTATPGSRIPLSLHYDTGQAEVDRALALGLVDFRATKLAKAGAFGGSIGPTALIPLGDYTGVAGQPSSTTTRTNQRRS